MEGLMVVHFGYLGGEFMLLYLTSVENIGLFDFLIERGMLIEKISGEISVKKFVIHDKRNLSHFSHIIIDLESIEDTVDDLVDALKAIKAIYDAKIILYTKNVDLEILNKIIDDAKIYNIISGKTIQKIREEIKICLGSGMTRHYVKMAINLFYDYDEDVVVQNSITSQDIKILVSGTMNRVGTTTTAINMAVFLSSLGAKVSYTEGNESNHLSSIHSHFFFNNPIINDYFTDDKIHYYFKGNIPTGGYNFNIIDIGVLTSKNLKITEIGDINILCAGGRPYEMPNTLEKFELIKDQNNFKIIFPWELKGKDTIKELNFQNIYFSKYSSLFSINTNIDVWKSLLSEYI